MNPRACPGYPKLSCTKKWSSASILIAAIDPVIWHLNNCEEREEEAMVDGMLDEAEAAYARDRARDQAMIARAERIAENILPTLR